MTASREYEAYHQIDIALTCLDHAGKVLRDAGDPDRMGSTALWIARAEMALRRIQPNVPSPLERARHAAACAMFEYAESRQHH